jgi:hypothetical protein
MEEFPEIKKYCVFCKNIVLDKIEQNNDGLYLLICNDCKMKKSNLHEKQNNHFEIEQAIPIQPFFQKIVNCLKLMFCCIK